MAFNARFGAFLVGFWTTVQCFDLSTLPSPRFACNADNVLLPWDYSITGPEIASAVYWYHYDGVPIVQTTIMVQFIPGLVLTPDPRFDGRAFQLGGYNGGLELRGVFPNDSGRVELEVQYAPGGPTKTDIQLKVYEDIPGMLGVEIVSISGKAPGGNLTVMDNQTVVVNLTMDELPATVSISWQGEDILIPNCVDTCSVNIDIKSTYTSPFTLDVTAVYAACGIATSSHEFSIVHASTTQGLPITTTAMSPPDDTTESSTTPASPTTSAFTMFTMSTADTTPSLTPSTTTGSTTAGTTGTTGTTVKPDLEHQGTMEGWKIAIIVIVCALVVALVVFLILWTWWKRCKKDPVESGGELQTMSISNGTPLNTNQVGSENKAYEQLMVEQKANQAQPINANPHQPYQSLKKEHGLENQACQEPKPDYNNPSTRVDPDPDYGQDDKIPNTFQNPDGSASVFVGQTPLQPTPDYSVDDPHVARAYSSGGGPGVTRL